LLNLSHCKIYLGKSSYYAQIALLIYASALLLLFYSSCFFALKILIALILWFQLLRILNDPRPYPDYVMLTYNKTGWVLLVKNNQEIFYERARIVIDAGLFFLLELSEGKKRNYLVIFFDQLNDDSYRLLNITQKIK
jgi:hypothetical protein